MSNEIDFLINKMKLIETTANTPIPEPVVESKIHPLIAATKDLIYEGVMPSVSKELATEYEQNAKIIFETLSALEEKTEKVVEASPDTVLGSLTDDLNDSKKWLTEVLKKGLKGRNPGTIYVLGSWYGNMGLYLDGYDIDFDKLVLVETDEEKLLTSGIVLDKIKDTGKLVLIHQSADDMVYESPGIIINTSCNETGPGFLKNVPEGMLCVLQARNSISNVMTQTNTLDEFVDQFPLGRNYYKEAKTFRDPETAYERFMVIGRALGDFVQKIDEVAMTPALFKQAIDTGAEKGVKVGFEFEVCVPKSNVKKSARLKVTIDTIFAYEETFSLLKVSDRDRFSKGEVTPETMDKLFVPNNQAKLSPNLTKFTDIVKSSDKEQMEIFKGMAYGQLVRLLYPRYGVSNIEKKINEFFHFPYPNMVISLFEKASGVTYNMDYLTKVNYDVDRLYQIVSMSLKPQIEQTFKADVVVFDEYHQKTKNTKSWYIEPDSSLGSKDGDTSLELVSPPLPAKEAMDALHKFYDLAESNNWYTGEKYSTGLHINVSIPQKIDVLKLAVFLGDQYVLKSFGREDNYYAVSIMQSLADTELRSSEKYTEALGSYKLRVDKLSQIAKEIASDHYMSASAESPKYISFRHAGGDYLAEKDKIVDTVGRFVRAMIIASDPKLYRNEYIKKLTKLFGAPTKEKTKHDRLSEVREIVMDIQRNGLPVYRWTIVYPKNEQAPKHFIDRTFSYLVLDELDKKNIKLDVVPKELLKATVDNIKDYLDNWDKEVSKRIINANVKNIEASTTLLFPISLTTSYKEMISKKAEPHYYSSGSSAVALAKKERLPYSDPRVKAWVKDLIEPYLKSTTTEGLGTGYPGTYEQENNKFKSHGQQRNVSLTNEVLDSSYPFKYENNVYSFITDSGNNYNVTFIDDGSNVFEVSFELAKEDGTFRLDLTNTGDSRKVFGTVVKTIQDFVSKKSPTMIYFTAEEDDTNRVKLYNALMNRVEKALPNYSGDAYVEDYNQIVVYQIVRKDTNENLNEAGAAPIYYFAYGMLTDPGIMKGIKLVGRAELKNFEYKMYLYANVEPKPGSVVYGSLWEIDRDYLSYLDHIEGYPTLYDRRTYPVFVDGERYVAEIYVMTPKTLQYVKGTFPDDGYIESIEDGYQNAGIPLEQLDDALNVAWEEYHRKAPSDYY